MATVYLATDLRLERRVALKVMHGHLSDDQDFRQRFIQEAHSAARLSDPNVVSVYDQGQDGEIAYLVMEYIPGVTLRELLREQGQLTIEQSVGIMDAILSGLASAHRADIVHRDIKPENVLLAEDGRIKIGDFGLARATSANTATGQQLLGTIAYLAPELVLRESAGARSDIYALGVMLYEMLTGSQPFRGEQPMQIAYKHANDPMPIPSDSNPLVPEQLDDLVQWATEKDPEDRPANASEMLQSLREAERELAIMPAIQREPSSFLDNPTGNLTKVLPTDDATAILPPAPPAAPVASALPVNAPEPTYDPQSLPEQEPEPIDNATVLRLRTKQRTRRRFLLLFLTAIAAAGALFAGLYFSVGAGANVAVPNLVGETEASAQALIASGELTGKREEAFDGEVPAGEVISQQPGPGESVPKDTVVTYTVSMGAEPVAFEPGDLIGLPRADAEAKVTELGLTLDAAPIEWFSPEHPVGQVTNVRTAPAGSTEFAECGGTCQQHKGDAVRLSISVGPVPTVAGETADIARQKLTDAGLEVAPENEIVFNSEVPLGHIVEVRMNEVVSKGDTVTLVESKGPELFAVPDVVGMTRDEAVKALEDAGFVAQINGLAWGLSDSATEVSRQDPAANEMREKGTSVALSLNIFGL